MENYEMSNDEGDDDMKVFLTLLFLLISTSAYAATATWTNDTVADLAATNVYRAPGSCVNPGAFAKVNTFPAPQNSGVLVNPSADGVYCHKATAVDTANNES